MHTSWAVYKHRKPIGIVETNYAYAKQYWSQRGSAYSLRPGYGFCWNGITMYHWKEKE